MYALSNIHGQHDWQADADDAAVISVPPWEDSLVGGIVPSLLNVNRCA